MSQFNAAHFQTVEAAREYLEALRWGGERVCPHCGSLWLASGSILRFACRYDDQCAIR